MPMRRCTHVRVRVTVRNTLGTRYVHGNGTDRAWMIVSGRCGADAFALTRHHARKHVAHRVRQVARDTTAMRVYGHRRAD